MKNEKDRKRKESRQKHDQVHNISLMKYNLVSLSHNLSTCRKCSSERRMRMNWVHGAVKTHAKECLNEKESRTRRMRVVATSVPKPATVTINYCNQAVLVVNLSWNRKVCWNLTENLEKYTTPGWQRRGVNLHTHYGIIMVVLHVKKGEESLFLYNSTVTASVDTVTKDVAEIYNARLRIDRLCSGSIWYDVILNNNTVVFLVCVY